jgi:WD40 repeat protein
MIRTKPPLPGPAFALFILACVSPIAFGQSADSANATRVDCYGDPLPAGALARLGTVRFRHAEPVSFVTFLPDGKTLLTAAQDQFVHLWDLHTGKEIRRFGKPAPVNENLGNMRINGMPISALQISRPMQVSLSADGKLLAAWDNDAIRLWQVDLGKEISKIDRSGSGTSATVAVGGAGGRVVFSQGSVGGGNMVLAPNGKTLATSGRDGRISLWATDTGKEIRQIEQSKGRNVRMPMGRMGTLMFSPDSKTVLSASAEFADRTFSTALRSWDVATGTKVLDIKGERGFPGMSSVAFAPGGKILAHSQMDGSIHLVDTATGKDVRQIKEMQFGGRFQFSPDGKVLATENVADGSISLWDVAAGKMTRRFDHASPRAAETGMAFAPDGKMLALVSEQTVRLLDLTSGKDEQPWHGHQTSIARVNFAKDGKSLLTKGSFGDVREWDAATGTERRKIHVALDQVASNFILTPDGKIAAVVCSDNTVRLIETATGKKLQQFDGSTTGFSAVAFSPDGRSLAAREMIAPVVEVFAVATGKRLSRMTPVPQKSDDDDALALPFTGAATHLLFSPDGGRVAASVTGNALAVWNVSTGRLQGQLYLPEALTVRSVAFAPDGRSLAIASGDDNLSLWEIATGKQRSFLGKKPKDTGDANGPSAGMMVRMRGAMKGMKIPVMSYFNEPENRVTFTPNGNVLAQARDDRTIALWEIAGGHELKRFPGHQGSIATVAFSDDGRCLASGSADTSALIWDVSDLGERPRPSDARLSENDLAACWAQLADNDAAKAFTAICRLSASPASTIGYLEKNLKPAAAVDSTRIDGWIADLDHNQFKRRQQASQELERLGELAEPAARKALQAKPSPEVRERLEQLLNKATGKISLGSDALRMLRSIEALERIANPEAQRILQALADGAPGALQTREAEESLTRLKHQDSGARR